MPKVGRNDLCPCGSGKKYKHCHLPLEEAAQAEQLRLRRSVDTLMPKIADAAQAQSEAIPAAFERFWNGKYAADQMAELDDLEGRGVRRDVRGAARRRELLLPFDVPALIRLLLRGVLFAIE